MAASTLPAPGKVVNGIEIGPCVEPCKHKDCDFTRREASSPCTRCGEPIGYEVSFFTDGDGLAHAACVYDSLATP